MKKLKQQRMVARVVVIRSVAAVGLFFLPKNIQLNAEQVWYRFCLRSRWKFSGLQVNSRAIRVGPSYLYYF